MNDPMSIRTVGKVYTIKGPQGFRPVRSTYWAAALVLAAVPVFAGSAFASCPVQAGDVTVIVRVPAGNLLIETTGVSTVEVETSKVVQVREVCGRETIEIEGSTTAPLRQVGDWKIKTPRGVNLDLTTHGGSITLKGDSDGAVRLRTSGGAVVAANIRHDALLYTQGGLIRVGNIGGNAELQSEGGNLEVGDVAGDATLKTASGVIRAGRVGGSVKAETGGGSITIKESRGEYVVATTKAGDIVVTGDARKVDVQTAGGGITIGQARGAFRGRTDSGDIKVTLAHASIDAYSGFGDINIKMAPDTASADLHVNIHTGSGNITFSLPENMRANIDATVDKVAQMVRQQPIISDFPMSSNTAPSPRGIVSSFASPGSSMSAVRGIAGGAPMKMRASVGSIQIRLTR